MAIRNPRNRVLIFRLTQEEYDAVQSASAGSRSISEYARDALLGSVRRSPVEERVSRLELSLAQLSERVKAG